MKKILVTGGAGYIGSHTVVELVENGFEPIVIDNFSNSEKSVMGGLKSITGQEIKLYEGDCNDSDFLSALFNQEKGIEGVIHFAAYKAVGESVQQPLKYYYNNINSLLVLLDTMKQNNCKKIVFSSSCTVYGQPDQLPVTEDTPRKPAESPYGNTKKICEDILLDTFKSGNNGLKSIALRYFNPIGAHPSALIGELPLGIPNNLIPFVTQTASGIRDSLTIFGDDYNTSDGTCVRDYIHVVDLAKAHVKALSYLESFENSVFDIFNIGTGNGNTVLEVVKAFEKTSGEKLNYKIGNRRPGDVEQVYANVDKAEKLLNWKSQLSLEDSLKDAWSWQQNLNRQKEYVTK